MTTVTVSIGSQQLVAEIAGSAAVTLAGIHSTAAAASAAAAAASASAASTSASGAATSASGASTSASGAATSASAASTSASGAATSASNASTSATNADTSEANAAASAAAAALAIWEPEGAWVTATPYTVSPRSVVTQGGNGYGCLVAHTSGTFATDLAAAKWALVVEKGADGAAYTDEQVRDVIGAALTESSLIVLAVNDAGDTIGIDVPAASTTEALTGTEAAKAVTPDALAALWEQGTDVASAATISLAEGGYFNVTGTTTITDVDFATDKAGRAAWVKFVGVLTLTHNATTLILPSGANIITAAGDTALFVSEGTDAVRCVAYMRASGAALVSSGGGATHSKAAADQTTTSATAVDITNLAFTPAANSTYKFRALVKAKMSVGGVSFKIGVAWPTGLNEGRATIRHTIGVTLDDTNFATNNTGMVEITNAAAYLCGALNLGTAYRQFVVEGIIRTGASPSGALKLQFASNGTLTATIETGSYIEYQAI